MKLHALTTVDHIVFCKLYLIYLLIHNLNMQAAELCKLYVLIFKTNKGSMGRNTFFEGWK